jgi:hypothetical protein
LDNIGYAGFDTLYERINRRYLSGYDNLSDKSDRIFDFDVNRKISVFISSKCDSEKYIKVRNSLREKLEKTKLFNVYLFEHNGASTLSAVDNYVMEEYINSDVVIFLIDNADGVPEGVQKEIDVAKKYNKKSLFYFCTENSKVKTVVQKQQTGSEASKYKEIEKFDELADQGFKDLVSDILNIYHYYCMGYVDVIRDSAEQVNSRPLLIEEPDSYIPNTILESLPNTSEKLLQEAVGKEYHFREQKEANKLDEIARQLLSILFDCADISTFDKEGLINELRAQKFSEILLENISMRFTAIEYYFMGDLDHCIEKLEKSLEHAQKSKLPKWLQTDLMIDLRNVKLIRGEINCSNDGYDIQEQLSAGDESVFYPVLDRLLADFHEKCIRKLFDNAIISPYTVTFGNNLNEFGNLLAGAFVIAMSHGSLTHILLLYQEMQMFTYCLSCKYNNWSIQRNLLKFAVFNGTEGDVNGLILKYPDLQNKMSMDDASIIMGFTKNHPLKYQRFKSCLLGMGVVGYYLSDYEYERWSTSLFGGIYE